MSSHRPRFQLLGKHEHRYSSTQLREGCTCTHALAEQNPSAPHTSSGSDVSITKSARRRFSSSGTCEVAAWANVLVLHAGGITIVLRDPAGVLPGWKRFGTFLWGQECSYGEGFRELGTLRTTILIVFEHAPSIYRPLILELTLALELGNGPCQDCTPACQCQHVQNKHSAATHTLHAMHPSMTGHEKYCLGGCLKHQSVSTHHSTHLSITCPLSCLGMLTDMSPHTALLPCFHLSCQERPQTCSQP